MNPTKATPWRRATNLAVAVVLPLLVFIGVAAPASAAPRSGDPLSTGCAGNASTIWERSINAVRVEVRYSRTCGTNWVRVSNVAGRSAEAGIWSPNNGWQWSPSYGNAPSQFWTPMVYAPGNTCVLFQAKFSKIGGGVNDTGVLRLCG